MSRRRSGLARAAAAGLLLAGCSGTGPQDAAPDSRFAELAVARSSEGLTREQSEGRALFRHYCAVCHGETGRGDGFNAFNLSSSFGVTPADLGQLPPEADVDRLQRVIAGGGPAAGRSRYMPPWGNTLDEAQIHALAVYALHLRPHPATDP